VVFSINDKKKDIAGSGTVTITGAVSAEITAGQQTNGGKTVILTGIVNGESVSLTNTDIQDLSSFSIGNIPASAGEYINVYFTVKNKSQTDKLKVTVLLQDGNGEEFAAEHITTAGYTTGDMEGVLDKLNWALNAFDNEMLEGQDIYSALIALGGVTAENYLAYYGIIPYDNCLYISPNTTQSVLVRYNIGELATSFSLGISLCFESTA
jgi:hypothetical protein